MNEENKEQNAISKQFKEMQKNKISKEYEHHAVLVKSEENS